jgi:hypothetical protein
VWLGAAAAAMLLVATGVGIGRLTAPAPAAAPAAARSASTLPANPVTVTGEATVPEAGAPQQVATALTPSSAPRSGVSSLPRENSQPNVASNTSERPVRPQPSRLTPSRTAPGATSAYQLTALQNLSEAEALLTSFRSRSSADQQMDAQLGTWARQLLTNTRLLLDSPVGDDPQRRPLLQDLELVLVQIVQQVSPGSTPQDRELIEKTMRDNHVMTRLRTAIPAGAQRGG